MNGRQIAHIKHAIHYYKIFIQNSPILSWFDSWNIPKFLTWSKRVAIIAEAYNCPNNFLATLKKT